MNRSLIWMPPHNTCTCASTPGTPVIRVDVYLCVCMHACTDAAFLTSRANAMRSLTGRLLQLIYYHTNNIAFQFNLHKSKTNEIKRRSLDQTKSTPKQMERVQRRSCAGRRIEMAVVGRWRSRIGMAATTASLETGCDKQTTSTAGC